MGEGLSGPSFLSKYNMDFRTLIEAATTITAYHGGDNPEPHNGMYFSSDPSFAEDYGEVYKYSIRLGKMFDSLDPKMIEPMLPVYDPYFEKEVSTVYQYLSNFSSDTWEIIEQHLDAIRNKGYDSIRIFEGGIENYYIFDQHHIRMLGKLS